MRVHGKVALVQCAFFGVTIFLFRSWQHAAEQTARCFALSRKNYSEPRHQRLHAIGKHHGIHRHRAKRHKRHISPTFTYTSSNPGVVDISPAGSACAGSWNAPYYNVCTPAGIGQAEITASALGATSPPTLVFVHPPIDNIQVTWFLPSILPLPPALAQTALPAECNIQLQRQCRQLLCLSQNQVQTLQATAYSNGVDITASVGPFTWSQTNLNVVTITPIVTSANSSSVNVPTNQATVVSNTPGRNPSHCVGFRSLQLALGCRNLPGAVHLAATGH